MSFDLYLAPASGFRDWTDEQWQAFFEGEPEYEQLGNATYIGLVEDAISHNLEDGHPGSKFPLLLGRSTADVIGWYADEIPKLEDEIRSIRIGLSAVPINRLTMQRDNDEEVRQIVARLQSRKLGVPVNSLYDLFHHYVDTFQQMSERARVAGQGLWLSF